MLDVAQRGPSELRGILEKVPTWRVRGLSRSRVPAIDSLVFSDHLIDSGGQGGVVTVSMVAFLCSLSGWLNIGLYDGNWACHLFPSAPIEICSLLFLLVLQ